MSARKTTRTALATVEPLHLYDLDPMTTLCGVARGALPVAPASYARRTWAGPRCQTCWRMAGILDAQAATKRRPASTASTAWEQLTLDGGWS